MSEALEAVGDTYSINGFTSEGRRNVKFYVVKDFDEKYSDEVKRRIGGITYQNNTRLGAAIRHASAKLAKQDARTRLLIVLSDGRPYDHDYGDARYADRLEDPGPAGRAKARDLMVRTGAEAAAIPPDGLSVEDRITRDMLQVIADLHVEEDDQHLYQLRVVDQMGGPQQLLPQLTQFQPADTPERLEAFITRLDPRLQAVPAMAGAA